jgi:hypothetical protein
VGLAPDLEISFSMQPWASPISGDQLLGTARGCQAGLAEKAVLKV